MSVINGLLWPILGLFLGVGIGFYVYRTHLQELIAEAIASVMVKKNQQRDSVVARYTNQSVEVLIDSVADSIQIGGVQIPGSEILRKNLPGVREWIIKKARKNPEATMYTLGRTLGPFLMGMWSERRQNKETDAIKQMLMGNVIGAKNIKDDVNTHTHGSPIFTQAPVLPIIPQGENHASPIQPPQVSPPPVER